MSSEFELIELFQHIGAEFYKQNGIITGPGDDCAIFDIDTPIVTSVDSSVIDVHFPSNASPQDIGYRARDKIEPLKSLAKFMVNRKS